MARTSQIEDGGVPEVQNHNLGDEAIRAQAEKLLSINDTTNNPIMKDGYKVYFVPTEPAQYNRAVNNGIHVCTKGDGFCLSEDAYSVNDKNQLVAGADCVLGAVLIAVDNMRKQLLSERIAERLNMGGATITTTTVQIEHKPTE